MVSNKEEIKKMERRLINVSTIQVRYGVENLNVDCLNLIEIAKKLGYDLVLTSFMMLQISDEVNNAVFDRQMAAVEKYLRICTGIINNDKIFVVDAGGSIQATYKNLDHALKHVFEERERTGEILQIKIR